MIDATFTDYFCDDLESNAGYGDKPYGFSYDRQVWVVDSAENAKLMDECEILIT